MERSGLQSWPPSHITASLCLQSSLSVQIDRHQIEQKKKRKEKRVTLSLSFTASAEIVCDRCPSVSFSSSMAWLLSPGAMLMPPPRQEKGKKSNTWLLTCRKKPQQLHLWELHVWFVQTKRKLAIWLFGEQHEETGRQWSRASIILTAVLKVTPLLGSTKMAKMNWCRGRDSKVWYQDKVNADRSYPLRSAFTQKERKAVV